MIPRSMTLHLSLPQSGHSKLYPIFGLFSAAPTPSSFCCSNFSVVDIEEFSAFVFVLHLRHTRYSWFSHIRIFSMPLHFLQNIIGMFFRIEGGM